MVTHVVALGLHAPEDIGDGVGDVQVAGADVRLARGVVVIEQRDLLLAVRLVAQRRVLHPPPHSHAHALGDWPGHHRGQAGGRIAHLLLRAHHGRRHRPGELGHGEIEGPLEVRQPARVQAELDVGAGLAVRVDQQPLGRHCAGIAEYRDRLPALPFYLADECIDQGRIARVVGRLEEADGDAGRAGLQLAVRLHPGLELFPGPKDAATRTVWIVVAEVVRDFGRRHVELGDTRFHEREFHEVERVARPGVLEIGAGLVVKDDALLGVGVGGQQALADTQHHATLGDFGDQVRLVVGVPLGEHLFVHGVEHQNLARPQLGRRYLVLR